VTRVKLHRPCAACLDVDDCNKMTLLVEDHDSPGEAASKPGSAIRDSGREHKGVRGDEGCDSDDERAAWMPDDRPRVNDRRGTAATSRQSGGENTQAVGHGPRHYTEDTPPRPQPVTPNYPSSPFPSTGPADGASRQQRAIQRGRTSALSAR
jgi:hypothetical protein